MNCEQFSSMLIGPVFGRPAAEQLMAARLHLSGCRHCGVDWEIHSRLVAMPVPAMPASLEGRCRAAVARTGGGWDGRRRPNRQVIFGTVLLVAAAAAAMVVSQRKDAAGSVARIADVLLAEPLSRPGQGTDPQSASGAGRDSLQGTGAGVDKDRHEEIAQLLYPQGFTVTLFPLIQEIQEPAGRAAAERYFQAVAAQLRLVPRLKLVLPGESANPVAGEPGFRITMRSRETVSSGPRREVWSWSVGMQVARPGSPGNSGLFSSGMTICDHQEEGSGYCKDAVETAARVVDMLRQNVFFPGQRKELDEVLADEEAFKAQRTAESNAALANRALPFTQRLQALAYLTPSFGRPTWDDDTVRGALELAAEADDDAALLEVWRRMRGTSHPDILRPALDLLDSGVPDQLRTIAVTVLAESFADHPEVMPTLERLAGDPSAGLVGQLAARAVHGEVAWRDSVLASLQDAGRSAVDRFEPIAYMLEYSTQTEIRLFLEDDGILAALAQVLPSLWNRPDMPVVQLVEYLGGVRQQLAAEILLRVARETRFRATAVEALGRESLRHARVREELGKIAASDPEPAIREMARSALASASFYIYKAR